MLIVKVDSATIGDIVKIYGVLGSMNGAWQKVLNTTIYSYTLTSSNLINETNNPNTPAADGGGVYRPT